MLTLLQNSELAWGPLGHRMVAETAALLMEKDEADLGGFLARHRFELGFYAFLPDSQFRHEGKRLEPPTHFFDIDRALGIKPGRDFGHAPSAETQAEDLKALQKIPASFKIFSEELRARLHVAGEDSPEAQARVQELVLSSGSAPWRVDQFLKMVKETLEPVKNLKGTYQSGQIDPAGAGRLASTPLNPGFPRTFSNLPAKMKRPGWKSGGQRT